jgi:AcrR family transcriptional regulator
MASPSRRADPRAKLTPERILDVAQGLLRGEGTDGLSMRRLAAALGVAPMTVYGYFPDKDSLIDAIIDTETTELDLRIVPGAWQEQLRDLLILLYDQLVANPFVVQLRQRRPVVSPGAMRFTEAGLQLLQHAGLTVEAAAAAFRTLFIYTFGYAAFASPPDEAAARRHALAACLTLPVDEYPAVTSAAQALTAVLTGRDQFLRGLDLILHGIKAEPQKSPPRKRPPS